jgi:RES domain-containing protein
MPSATWTPAALSSELRPLSGQPWRVVEAQHRVSTMKLVDTLEEQARLEVLLDETKPPVPADCQELHYLLSTPFRYGAPYPTGSRFRRAGLTPGVFYASAAVRTAIAETAFHRLLFFGESPHTPWPANAGEYTAFTFRFRARSGLDLSRPPLDADAEHWTDPIDYSWCQALADAARETGALALRYRSARNPAGVNVALLTCRAFVSRQPADRQTWRIHLGSRGARAVCDSPEARLEFDRAAFARDPRVASMIWERE